MVHLEVINEPPALKGKSLTHRNIECLSFKFSAKDKELSIYETYREWVDDTPAYTICFVTNIIYWNDKGGNEHDKNWYN